MKFQTNAKPIDLRKMCRCGNDQGVIDTRGGQDCVFCSQCGVWQYNAPKVETGREVRSTKTVHEAIKPKVRSEVLLRANGKCELCGKSSADAVLHVGHVISVITGLQNGLTEVELNDLENLLALCDECNLGLGDQPIPLRFMIQVIRARLTHAQNEAKPQGELF